ncbi:MAG TPA: hypothetical protein VKD25_01520 [Burkholderiales bacterium]|nr:hypothetical protein [Burkholderiales bacterium]
MKEADYGLVSAEANLLGKLSHVVFDMAGRSQNRPVRFWIITMMLVLVGLSTLKLR